MGSPQTRRLPLGRGVSAAGAVGRVGPAAGIGTATVCWTFWGVEEWVVGGGRSGDGERKAEKMNEVRAEITTDQYGWAGLRLLYFSRVILHRVSIVYFLLLYFLFSLTSYFYGSA